MSPLLTLLNHLITEALGRQASTQGFEVRALLLDEGGMRVVAQLAQGAWQGELALRLEVEPPQGTGQGLRLHVDTLPEGIPTALEPFRQLLSKARLRVELDFAP